MKVSFIVPPDLINAQPAERTAGCTRVVYQMPNTYELTVAAVLEQEKIHQVTYTDFVYQGKGEDDLRRFLTHDQAQAYIIWTVNLSIDTDLLTIGIINELVPQAYVVLMGPGPTYFTSKCLVNDNVIIVRGEPEETARELFNHLHHGTDWHLTKGISYRSNGNIHNNPSRPLIADIDALPLPARHLIAGQTYHNAKLKVGPYTTALTSRNCPYQCIYCVPSSLTFAREIEYRRQHGTKPTIAFRSTQSVEHEMELLHRQGFKAIGFVDDNFIWNEKRTSELCQIMKKYGMVWGCQARVDAITEPIAKMLGESGCKYVDLGVESFDDRILKFIKKGITSSQIYQAIALLKKHHVPVKLNVLIGSSPLETKETLKHTLREAKKLHVDQVMFNIVSPFPGTEFYTLCKQNGWLSTPDYVPTDVQRHSILNYPHLTAKEMERILFRNNISYFLSPRFIAKQIVRFNSFTEFKSALKALRIKLFGIAKQE
ncbi:MAG: B12-binding domain-containing radical SAM protein [Muribaculaceae bacterium]